MILDWMILDTLQAIQVMSAAVRKDPEQRSLRMMLQSVRKRLVKLATERGLGPARKVIQ